MSDDDSGKVKEIWKMFINSLLAVLYDDLDETASDILDHHVPRSLCVLFVTIICF